MNRSAIGRRAALLAAAGTLSGCGIFDPESWFGTTKKPLPGKREPVVTSSNTLAAGTDTSGVITLPTPQANVDWPQPGGSPTHVMGQPASAGRFEQIWRADIGSGSGYRRKLTAQPVVSGGVAYTMDSDATVTAIDLGTGRRRWSLDTQARKDRSTNIGGGLTTNAGAVYATTGRGDVVAINAAKGNILWRKSLGMPARSAPTWAAGRIYFTTIDDRLLAFSEKDGAQAWSYQAASSNTTFLGQPAPAFADGLVVAGFGSGDLAAVAADTGVLAWTDSLASGDTGGGLADLSAVRGLPVVDNGVVYAIGIGGVMLALDLRSGRRLWQRAVAGSETPWLAGDWLFIVTIDQEVAAVRRSDGAARWIVDLPRYQNPKKQRDPILWTGPVLTGQHLVVAGDNAQVLALDPSNGKIVATQKLPGPVSVPPLVASGTLLLLTDDGVLLALR